MSVSVPACLYLRAMVDGVSFETLAKKAMEGISSIEPCKCSANCRELTEEEKKSLAARIDDRVRELRKERNESIDKRGLSVEEMCRHVSRSLNEKNGLKTTVEDVYDLSPRRDITYYLELYEMAVMTLGFDFFDRPALDYFEDRLLKVREVPELAPLETRYKQIILALSND